MKYNLSEIFEGVQGEGPDAGRPAVFVRLSGCNLRCKFGNSICDTPYTSYTPESNLVKFKDVMKMIEEYQHKFVVITGGEPMLQNIRPLVIALKKKNYDVAVETNGTRPLFRGCRFIVSPKLTINPDWPPSVKLRTAVEDNIIRAERLGYDYWLKFVVQGEDISEVHKFLSIVAYPFPKGISYDRVYLMPEGITPSQIAENGRWAWRHALAHGFRYCSRYHVQLFGNQRAV